MMRIPKQPEPPPQLLLVIQGRGRGAVCRVLVYDLVEYEEHMTRRKAETWAKAFGFRFKRRRNAMKKLVTAALSFVLFAASVAAEKVCCDKGRIAWVCDASTDCRHSMFGACAAPYAIVERSACAALATPTPAPSATATPTAAPTPVPFTGTIKQFLTGTEVGDTYLQAMTMLDGVLFGNAGVCCPGLGDGKGECVFSVDYNVSPPVYREWFCTYRDTKELWETGSVQVAHSDRYPWVFAGQASMRPAVDKLIRNDDGSCCRYWPALVWSFTAQTISEQFFSWGGSVAHDILAMPGSKAWPVGILDLQGARYLYSMYMTADRPDRFLLARFVWLDARHYVTLEREWLLSELAHPISGIAVDVDGSLLATWDEEQAGPPVVAASMTARTSGISVKPLWWPSACSRSTHVIRSRDEGRTWQETGITFAGSDGRCVVGCAFAHDGRGAAVQPWLLLCTSTSGKGPAMTPSDWNAAYVAWPGAKLPKSIGQKPIIFGR